MFGVVTGPPKASETPKPMSSISMTTTFGAPFGAVTAKRGEAVALRTSNSVYVFRTGSLIGRTERSISPDVFCAYPEKIVNSKAHK
ncbi:hypothetical protein D3C84_150820 [compost metagenome]